MDDSAGYSFEERVYAEMQKRKNIVAEAEEMLQIIEQHYQEKQAEAQSVAIARNELLTQIQDIAKQRDISKLNDLLERLG